MQNIPNTYFQPIEAYKMADGMVPKTKQVVMLYDGTIRFVQQAKKAIEENNIQERYNSLSKACEILNGLQLSLDMERGGEISKLLYEYYSGLDMRLLSVHMSNDANMLEHCIKHLKMMREAWEEIDQKYGTAPAIETDHSMYQQEIRDVLQHTTSLEHDLPPREIDISSGLSVSC